MRLLLLSILLALPAAPAWPRAGGGGGGGGGGCFPAGTPVLTLTGEVPIEKVRPGIKVLAFSNDKLLQCEVIDFIEKKDRLVRIRTGKGTLTATSEHPLLTPFGFTEVRDLRKGDEVGVFEDGRRVWTRIKSIRPGGVAQVYNLEVAPPHTFIAGGFIVHNKGGFGGSFGGGYSRSYSSYGGYGRRRHDTFFDKIMLAIAATILAIKGYASFSGTSGAGGSGGASRSGSSGGRVDGSLLAARSARTREILAALARRDKDFSPEELQQWVKDVFLKVQLAWQARDYTTLRGVMMPYMHASHSAKVEAMRARGEVNMMDDLQVLAVDFVHVRCPAEKEGRAFSVLITASARDYTVNERLHTELRPPEPQTFQEFWTFNQLGGSWALARIDQVGDLDFMNAPNLPDSPEAAAAVPGKAPRPAGDAAYQPRGAQAQPPADAETSFERGADLLRSLAPAAAVTAAAGNRPAQPAPAASPAEPAQPAADRWNRQKMEIAATLAFESVYEAWGSNDSTLLNRDFVSGEALEKLKQVMRDRKAEGLSFEFKNLFTRRADVVLTSPAERSRLHLDEFTARITATAMRAILRNGKVLKRDEAPEPFTEYWVFGRQLDSWKLRDILPRMEQASEDRAQDGAPSPVQIEWYWNS
ncbi:MAG: TIM44-like domain-containing protein [Elusimicrobiales bacterium]|nr:TIM44-like domain-containing protein [Elusimicrobiales bacterium]